MFIDVLFSFPYHSIIAILYIHVVCYSCEIQEILIWLWKLQANTQSETLI